MLADYMFSQSHRSLIDSQKGCLDNSNPNSVTGSTANQFETLVRVDISARLFYLTFISVVNLSMTLLYFSSIVFFFISVLIFFRLSSVISYAVSSDAIFAGVHKFNFRCLTKYYNGQSTVPGWKRN